MGAHAFHNAYVKVIEGRRPTHGEILVLGSLFQILLEDLQESRELALEIDQFYKKIGLLRNFKELGTITDDQLLEMASLLVDRKDSRMQSVFPDISLDRVTSVLMQLRE
ncbi:glycerol dehydrogenase [Streptococcus hyovaginalis]|uniref:glycerol dehydrogenase n=1 Tax=Streptococcus hyovaginalis TaxID=149015 RepID=UPI0020163E60|nr:glycerol dehydrogenase [Streptococcus hyovaginalis]